MPQGKILFHRDMLIICISEEFAEELYVFCSVSFTLLVKYILFARHLYFHLFIVCGQAWAAVAFGNRRRGGEPTR